MNMRDILFAGLILVGVAGCGPTVQEIQAVTCSNPSFPVEWRCVKNAMSTNPRHQMPQFRQVKAQYIMYGNKLEIAVNKKLMPDYQASMMLMEYADAIDRGIMQRAALWNQMNANIQRSIDANRVITCTHNGSFTVCQ